MKSVEHRPGSANRAQRSWLGACAALGLFGLFSPLESAQALPVPIPTPDLGLIPLTTTASGAATYLEFDLPASNACASIGPINFCVLAAKHLFFQPASISFVGGNEVATAESEVIAQISINGSAPVSVPLTGPATITAFGRTSDSETGTFSQQMTFDLTGSLGPVNAEFRSRADMATSGTVTFDTVGGQDFTTSFFGVWPEISADGGATFTPELVPGGGTQYAYLEVPEPGTMTVLALGLGVLARVRGRGRRAG